MLENSIGLLDRVDDDTGMVHESAPKAANYMGWVGYQPDMQAYYDDSYTRTHFITLLSDMGFLAKADKAIDYFDRWMMYFPRSYPALQMGGKPVPGHATVIANDPHVYFDKLTKLGNWPTKFKTHDYGNPETDGHGILMLGRHRAWAKQAEPGSGSIADGMQSMKPPSGYHGAWNILSYRSPTTVCCMPRVKAGWA